MKIHSVEKARIGIVVFLAAIMGGLVAVSTGGVLVVASNAHFGSTTELIVDSSKRLIESLEREVLAHASSARNIVEYAGRQASEGILDPADKVSTIDFLTASMAAAPQVAIVAMWRSDGYLVEAVQRKGDLPYIATNNVSPGDDDYLGTLEFLDHIRKRGRVQWSQPTREEGVSIMTVFAPLYRDGQFLGMVGAGLSIDSMSSFIAANSTEDEAMPFVLFGEKHVIAHPNVLHASSHLIRVRTHNQ